MLATRSRHLRHHLAHPGSFLRAKAQQILVVDVGVGEIPPGCGARVSIEIIRTAVARPGPRTEHVRLSGRDDISTAHPAVEAFW